MGTSKNVATHPVAQLKQEDIPLATPLQSTHRSLSLRTRTFHTTYDINGISRSGFVKMAHIKVPGEASYSINDVDFANAARFFEKAKTRVGMANASLASLSVRRRSSPFDNKGFRIQWHVSLKSGVNEASVTYDNDGTEMDAKKNGDKIGGEK